MLIQHVAIVGLGILGGSLAQALKKKDLVRKITAVTRSQKTLDMALEAKTIDRGIVKIDETLRDCDLVILCTPVSQILKDIVSLSKVLSSKTIVTDVGSTKQIIVSCGDQYLSRFVGAHPLAGSEKSGLKNAKTGLFEGADCLITPSEKKDKDALKLVKDFWIDLGTKVHFLNPREHDNIIAHTSHLPHFIAASLVQSLSAKEEKFVSKGYWDTTRVASGEVKMWRDIFSQNREALLAAILKFEKEMDNFKSMLEEDKMDALEGWLEKAKMKRDLGL
ncbi:hypothetical protein AB834_02970 [PVC group bacterium (ex Bugula neritina AB1)]|nr:hypothetical protein AB834_02970 [PVC group bacterium (ex Bugula neritina AB1)]